MPFLQFYPRELRLPEAIVLPDGRKRLTRTFGLTNRSGIPAELDLSYGMLDPFPQEELEAPWQGLRLTGKQAHDEASAITAAAGKDTVPVVELIFETIPESDEIQVGNPEVNFDQAGVKTVILNFLQFSTGTSVYQTVGTTAAPSPHTDAILKLDERADDGTLQRIKRTYINSGLISQTDEIKNNGSLLIRTLVYLGTIPPTPLGFVLFAKKVESPNGRQVYTYSFAQGSGIISTQTEYLRSVDNGATGVTKTTIKYLSASSVSSNPISPPGGSATLESGFEDSDGYRIWTGVYATGTGVVDSAVETRNNGKLIVYSITSLNTPPSAPAATIGGTVVLVKSSQRNSPRLEEGAIVYDYVWIEGNGLIANIIHVREDGLREQTYISLGVRQAPSAGVIIEDNAEQEDGLTKYTVKAMQSSSGNDPTSETLTLQRNVPFLYPGRAKAYSKPVMSGTMIDVYLDPPQEASIPGSVAISYQTSSALTGIGTRWLPLQWACVEAFYVTFGGTASSTLQGLRGYRAINSGTAVTVTTPGVSYGPAFYNTCTCVGKPVYGNTTATLTVYGGPAAPDGNTYVLEASTELAFVSTTGTKYYRQMVTSATIPSQPSLPV